MSFFDKFASKLKEGIDDIKDKIDHKDEQRPEGESYNQQYQEQEYQRPPQEYQQPPQEYQRPPEQEHRPPPKHDDKEGQSNNRFRSFAPQRSGNNAKWFVDGCGYMWAVSVAIEEARESIWILDWWLSPELYLRRPPSQNEQYRVDRMLLAAAERGVKVNVIVYKEVSQILTLCSEHTKHALEQHPNIAVFRHPDHAPSGQVLESGIVSTLENLSFNPLKLAKLPGDGLKALYGETDDIILYWAHHEKLCLIDGRTAFMGGLDLCFGRWDTNSHPLADAHPTDVNKALFPGQDFNNARVYDFEDVTNWDKNKLDRLTNSRMGWSDLSLCLQGPVVEDIRAHFAQRWNFIFKEKYDVREKKYGGLMLRGEDIPDGYYQQDGTNVVGADPGRDDQQGVSVQLVRSCTKWSNGVATEHSIANAYIEVIQNSRFFVYIENQFFITATGDKQGPIKNQIGAALVARIVRAYQAGEPYKVIVCMPSVPAFAGDLHADDSLGTRAIMEFQYNSICRGGHSIMEEIQKAGVPDARQYIRFYNLRNYDRINGGAARTNIEQESGVNYEDARREHDDMVGAGYDGRGYQTGAREGQYNREYDQYQQAASQSQDSQFDTVSACYMEGGPSITDIPFSGSEEEEMDAFVSEELYIHSKVLIADDRTVICGSANLNDRSQLGSHDSEIAVVIQDNDLIDSSMAGQGVQVSRYAASLRRQLFRKHLGLLPDQDCTRPDENFLPLYQAGNAYDWGSPSDNAVADPLSPEFDDLWNRTASTNTAIFSRAFHPVPADNVRNWQEYESFYGSLFFDKKDDNGKVTEKATYAYGHVVKEEFGGGVRELKDVLAGVRGTLVEMSLEFMRDVDFAVEGLKLNAFTDDVYT